MKSFNDVVTKFEKLLKKLEKKSIKYLKKECEHTTKRRKFIFQSLHISGRYYMCNHE
jgi:hypothetical protein